MAKNVPRADVSVMVVSVMSTNTSVVKGFVFQAAVPKVSQLFVMLKIQSYEGCSNMNESSFITFFTYMLQQNGKRFYKGRYVTFKLVPDLKKNTVYLSSYSPLNEGHVSILTNSMLRTYTSEL